MRRRNFARSVATAILAIFLFGTIGASAQAELPTVSASQTITVGANFRNFQQPAPPATGEPITSCSGGTLTTIENGLSLKFREDETETGCGEALIMLPTQEGAREIWVTFRPTRTLNGLARSAPIVEPSFAQELVVYETDWARGTVYPIFEPQTGTDESGTQKVMQIPNVGPDQESLFIGWRFSDQGQYAAPIGTATPIGAGARWSATVFRPQFVFEDIPISVTARHTGQAAQLGGILESRTTYGVEVPTAPANNTRQEVSFDLSGDWAIRSVVGPDGRTAQASEFTVGDRNGTVHLTLPHETLQNYGAGTYLVEFQIDQVPSQTAGSTFVALLVVSAPGLAALPAFRNAADFRRQAVGIFVETARNMRLLLFGGLAFYALFLTVVLATFQFKMIAAWPAPPTTVSIQLLFIGLAVVFLLIGIGWKKRLIVLLDEELQQRRVTEARLRRSNEELENFAYVASHDLQEPLRTVTLHMQKIARRYQHQWDSRAQEDYDFANLGAQRMKQLVADLLEYSRLDKGEHFESPIQLQGLLESVIATLEVSIQQSGADVSVECNHWVQGDPRLLLQLFQNLLSNAIKFRDPSRPLSIELHSRRQDNQILLSVRDNGIGIPADQRENIFKIFSRLEANDSVGSGMGLAICRKIVMRHGGRIYAADPPTGAPGTLIWIQLMEGHGPDA